MSWSAPVVGLLGIAAASAVSAAETWSTYANDRFGATIDYPSRFSVRADPPANGDGQRFSTPDCRATLAAYGSLNGERRSFRALMEDAREPGMLYSLASARADSFVLSGLKGDRVTYQRCIRSRFSGDIVNCLDMEYPAAEARSWDAVVTRISGSLRSGRPY